MKKKLCQTDRDFNFHSVSLLSQAPLARDRVSSSWGGGGGTAGGDIPPLFLLIQKETCHQGIINSWLCYSLLGEALGGFSKAYIFTISRYF